MILLAVTMKHGSFLSLEKMILVPEKATEDGTDVVHDGVDPHLKLNLIKYKHLPLGTMMLILT